MNNYTPSIFALEKYPMYCIYGILCIPTSQIYIGQAMIYEKRVKQHFYNLRGGRHPNAKLQLAWDQYGESCFHHNPIEQGIDSRDIQQRERYWVKHFKSIEAGFNQFRGGAKPYQNLKGRSVEYQGITYSSLAAAARSFGITTNAMALKIYGMPRWIFDERQRMNLPITE